MLNLHKTVFNRYIKGRHATNRLNDLFSNTFSAHMKTIRTSNSHFKAQFHQFIKENITSQFDTKITIVKHAGKWKTRL